MSLAPYSVRGNRFGTRFGVDLKLEDTLWAGLTDAHVKLPMALTAENLAEQYKLTRKDCDEYAVQSQKRWKHANANGHFKDEIAPVKIKGKKGDEFFQTDEHARGDATIEELGKLAPVFKKNGTVTAGNASGVCDGAASVIIADEESVKKYNLKPLARFAGYHASGCDPKIMGIYFIALKKVYIN
jgi:acetyl-CoA acyltransferase 2